MAHTITYHQSTKKTQETVQDPNLEFLDEISALTEQVRLIKMIMFRFNHLYKSTLTEAREQTQEEDLSWVLEEMGNAEEERAAFC